MRLSIGFVIATAWQVSTTLLGSIYFHELGLSSSLAGAIVGYMLGLCVIGGIALFLRAVSDRHRLPVVD